MLKQKARAGGRSNHDSPRSTVTPTKIAERAYPTNYSFRLKPGKEIASGLSLPLKRGWWGCSFRSVVSTFSAFGFMPIHEADPWRLQYFTHVKTDVDITTEDSDAWQWYPAHRWVYDKLAIAQSQGIEAGPHGTKPPRRSLSAKSQMPVS